MTVGVDEMPAGIELDILVAEALGYVLAATARKSMLRVETPIFTVMDEIPSYTNGVYIRHVGDSDFGYFAPSTDIRSAWEVVQILNRQGYSLQLSGVEKSWIAAFVKHGLLNAGQSRGEGPIPSLAICHAALKVMEGK